MRRSTLALSTVGIAMTALVGHALADGPSGPFRLSPAQLDGLTAGLLVVTASAVALADGPTPVTLAETETAVVQLATAEVGWGAGTAVAIGDNPVALVATGFDADGQLVLAFTTGERVDGHNLAAASETLFVVSLADLGKKKNPVKVDKKGNVVVKGALKGSDKKFVHQAAKAIDKDLYRAVKKAIR